MRFFTPKPAPGLVDIHESMRDQAFLVYRQHLREARAVWATDSELRDAAALLGMDEPEYCDRFMRLHFGHWPLFFVSSMSEAATWKQRFADAWDWAACAVK